MREAGAEARASIYAVDRILGAPDQPSLKGGTKIRNFNAGAAGSGIGIDLDHIEIGGELAFVTGLSHWSSDVRRQPTASKAELPVLALY